MSNHENEKFMELVNEQKAEQAFQNEKLENGWKTILDLCGGTGSWSKPYREAGYNVITVDPLAENDGQNFVGTVQEFLDCYEDWKHIDVHGVLFGPPCTEFAGSGARWWKDKNPKLLEDAIDVVRTGLKIIKLVKPEFWAMENPVGRLARMVPEVGQWCMAFQPNEYGDPYTKKTCLWGSFNTDLEKDWVEPTEGSKMHKLPPGPDRWRKRSVTPPGFANAFFEANR
jgi:hypothetical protein